MYDPVTVLLYYYVTVSLLVMSLCRIHKFRGKKIAFSFKKNKYTVLKWGCVVLQVCSELFA